SLRLYSRGAELGAEYQPNNQHDRLIKTSEERASVYIRSPRGRLESRRLLACGTKVVQIQLFNAKSSAQSERPVIFFAVPTRVKRGIVANSLTLKNAFAS